VKEYCAYLGHVPGIIAEPLLEWRTGISIADLYFLFDFVSILSFYHVCFSKGKDVVNMVGLSSRIWDGGYA
jgi:hypothetical protein